MTVTYHWNFHRLVNYRPVTLYTSSNGLVGYVYNNMFVVKTTDQDNLSYPEAPLMKGLLGFSKNTILDDSHYATKYGISWKAKSMIHACSTHI